MAVAKQLKEYLDKEKVSYRELHHPEAYSAMEIASVQHLPGMQVAKSVIVKADGKFIMCVLPSTHHIDFDKLRNLCGAKNIQLVKEDEISRLFPEYEVGAEPPFGHLYNLRVYVDKHLNENQEIAFNAGTHTDMVKMKWQDYLKLEKPILGEFGKRS